MMALYTLGVRAYGLAIRMASIFLPKAKKWTEGRKDWKQKLAAATASKQNWTWFHCASLGEFEQGRSLMEAIKAKHPEEAILLTFFSPSGYEIRKNYALADHVCYLPLDTRANAGAFLKIVQPRRAFFIKYDLWLNLLAALHAQSVPHYLVSALLRPDSRFLTSPLRSQYKKAFAQFSWIFAQDEETVKELRRFTGLENASAVGDTRFDRAAELPSKFEEVPGIQSFVAGRTCIVVGSSYEKEEAMLLEVREKLADRGLVWIIAPHEIDQDRISRHISAGNGKMARYSKLSEMPEGADLLWIDNIGMLSRLYHYATIAYVGGGFGKTVHNTQEPAAYGNPILFGPHFQNFREAVDMVEMGSAFSIQNTAEALAAIEKLLSDPLLLEDLRSKNRSYMQKMSGATELIIRKLEE